MQTPFEAFGVGSDSIHTMTGDLEDMKRIARNVCMNGGKCNLHLHTGSQLQEYFSGLLVVVHFAWLFCGCMQTYP